MEMILSRSKNVRTGWAAVQFMYKLLGSEDAFEIIQMLNTEQSIRSTVLLSKLQQSLEINEASFYFRINQLIDFGFVERDMDEKTRAVKYRITSYGKDLFALNKPLLEKVRKTLPA